MPGYGPAFFVADTARQIDDINGLKAVAINEGHADDVYVFCFKTENNLWKIHDVIESN